MTCEKITRLGDFVVGSVDRVSLDVEARCSASILLTTFSLLVGPPSPHLSVV